MKENGPLPREAAAPVITLLTDFGLRDGYVGAMKGVITRIAPEARLVDITHEIAPHDIRHGGLVWSQAVRYFPAGTIHVAVVDPGVGSRRKIVAFDALGSVFLAPDNGIIGHVLERREVRRAVEVRRREHFLPEVSATFHGRDVFAPVAARLARGLPLEALGPRCRSYQVLRLPRPRLRSVAWKGRRAVEARGVVIHIDCFGNVVTNLVAPPGRTLRDLRAGRLRLAGLVRAYSDVAAGRPLALIGSTGRVELSVNQGRAASLLGIALGDPVVGTWA